MKERLAELNKEFRRRMEKNFETGTGDEYDAAELALESLASEFERFKNQFNKEIHWDSNYTWDLLAI